MMQSGDEQWVSPSFNSYSSNGLADIAIKVSDEAKRDDVKFIEDDGLHGIVEKDGEEDDEFEFCFVRDDLDAEIVCDGQLRPIFPVFNRDLLDDFHANREGENKKSDSVRVPLKKMFNEEREQPSSSSSSEADELQDVPPGTFCVWRPRVAEPPPPSSCKKSKSTGSGSKRSWKLRDLLRRSNSDGKDSFVFLTAKRGEEKHVKGKNSAGKSKPSPSASPAHEGYYARIRGTKGNETPRRRSYLPYRQDLVGFFTTVNSIGRNLPRFERESNEAYPYKITRG